MGRNALYTLLTLEDLLAIIGLEEPIVYRCDFQRNRRIEKSRAFAFDVQCIAIEVSCQLNELRVEKSSASVEKVGVSSISVEKVNAGHKMRMA